MLDEIFVELIEQRASPSGQDQLVEEVVVGRSVGNGARAEREVDDFDALMLALVPASKPATAAPVMRNLFDFVIS